MLLNDQRGRLSGPALHPELVALLAELRRRRGFAAQRCVQAKISLLNTYMAATGLRSCVVGVSGGVDSAVTLALACAAMRAPGSPIQRVVAALVPMFVAEGATNQDLALARGREVAEWFAAQAVTVDLSAGHVAVKAAVDGALGLVGGPWAAGQLVSYLRAPAFYYLTSLLAQEGLPAVLLGTTNRDEGGYIGFFGKASDGMVDIQLISDLHKSEVYALARRLEVPASVIAAAPTGDVFDGRTDEQMIGASYDFVELYTLWLAQDGDLRDRLLAALGAEARAQFADQGARLEALHACNAHKYLGGSPAIHLDAYERAVPGGWTERPAAPVRGGTSGGWVGEFALSSATLDAFASASVAPRAQAIADCGDSALRVDGLVGAAEREALRAELERQRWVPVGRHGMLRGFDPARDEVGSYRATCYSPGLAGLLWARLAGLVPMLRTMQDDTPTDWQDARVWRAVGVNPLLRCIRYAQGGLLVPHYDAPYEAPDGDRTLMSVLIYLSEDIDERDGGATRLLIDPQRNRPLDERVYEDWAAPEPGDSPRVLVRVPARAGAALLLDHRLLHDGERLAGAGPKLLLRTDLVFRRCGPVLRRPARAAPPPLWARLGLEPGAPRDRVDAAYRALPPDLQAEPERRLAWKVLRDRFYAKAHAHLASEHALERAGFFDDRADITADNSPRERSDWLATPLHHVLTRLQAASERGRLVVLVSTGAFCPVHRAHLEMLAVARQALEARGAIVLGGYLSPSHDAYVALKCGARTLDARHRQRLCEEAVRGSDWLMVDGWEALENDQELNFTDVIVHLEDYLAAHVPCHRPIEVVYVFGGDNARFARTFLERGACVCINRPGHEQALAQVRADPRVAANPRIVFVDGPTVTPGISSSQVRLGDLEGLDAGVRERFAAWTAQAAAPPLAARTAVFPLRDEGELAVLPWTAGRAAAQVFAAREALVDGLVALLRAEFLAAAPPDIAYALEVRRLELAAQRVEAARRTAGRRVISLDGCIPGSFDLGVSRCFPLSAGSATSTMVARPGFAPIAAQLAAIPAGDYVLLDDDISTGETIRRVLALLPARLHIQEVVIVSPMTAPTLDVGDCRDFLVGAREGGLVVALPGGGLARAPYVLPYVSPSARASVPLSREREFSVAVWELNAAFFAAVSPPIRLAEADPAFVRLMRHVGFAPGTTMLAICQWHLQRLRTGAAGSGSS